MYKVIRKFNMELRVFSLRILTNFIKNKEYGDNYSCDLVKISYICFLHNIYPLKNAFRPEIFSRNI